MTKPTTLKQSISRTDGSLLDTLLKWETPKLYVFKVVSNLEVYKNNPYVFKFGDTRHPVESRLKEWERDLKKFHHTDDIRLVLVHYTFLVKDSTRRVQEDNPYMRDYAIHAELIKMGFVRMNPDEFGSNEFFRIPLSDNNPVYTESDIIRIVETIKGRIFAEYDQGLRKLNGDMVTAIQPDDIIARTDEFPQRFYQKRAIQNILKIWGWSDVAFLEHSPRTGKTMDGAWIVRDWFKLLHNKKAGKFIPKVCLILTEQPSVEIEHRKAWQGHKHFDRFIYVKTKWVGNEKCFSYSDDTSNKMKCLGSLTEIYSCAAEMEKDVVIFASCQDILGMDISKLSEDEQAKLLNEEGFKPRAAKPEWKPLFDHLIELSVIINDEAHIGVLNPKSKSGQMVQYLHELNMKNELGCKRLNITATAYKAQYNGICTSETVDYFSIQAFLNTNFDDLTCTEERDEWLKLREIFPDFHTICPEKSETFRRLIKDFEGKSSKKRNRAAIRLVKMLAYEFNESGLGFMENNAIIDNYACRHICITVASHEVAEVLQYILENPDKFKEVLGKDYEKFKKIATEYEVINLATDGAVPYKTVKGYIEHLQEVDERKDGATNEDGKLLPTKTLSISCERYLTGNTIPVWDCFIVLRTIKSAERYDQYTNRIYNPKFGKQHVIVWNWDIDSIMQICAYKAGLRKSDVTSGKSKKTSVKSNEHWERIVAEVKKLHVIIHKGDMRYTEVDKMNALEVLQQFKSSVNYSAKNQCKGMAEDIYQALLAHGITVKADSEGTLTFLAYKQGEMQDGSSSQAGNGPKGNTVKSTPGNEYATLPEKTANWIFKALQFLKALEFVCGPKTVEAENISDILCRIQAVHPEWREMFTNKKLEFYILEILSEDQTLNARFAEVYNDIVVDETNVYDCCKIYVNVLQRQTRLEQYMEFMFRKLQKKARKHRKTPKMLLFVRPDDLLWVLCYLTSHDYWKEHQNDIYFAYGKLHDEDDSDSTSLTPAMFDFVRLHWLKGACKIQQSHIKKWNDYENMNFDYIIQNPPYSGTLHIDFFKLALDKEKPLLNPKTGRMVIIEPGTWLVDMRTEGSQTNVVKLYNPWKDEMQGHVWKVIEENLMYDFQINQYIPLSITYVDMNKTFDEIEFSCCGSTKIVKSLYDCNLTGEKHSDILDIIKQLRKVCEANKLDMAYDHAYSAKQKTQPGPGLERLPYADLHGQGGCGGHGWRADNYKPGEFQKTGHKIEGVDNPEFHNQFIDMMVRRTTTMSNYIAGTHDEIEVWKWMAFNNILFLFLVIVFTIDQNNNCLQFIPWLVDKKRDDKEIQKYFGLSDEQMQLIYRVCKRFEKHSPFFHRYEMGPDAETA